MEKLCKTCGILKPYDRTQRPSSKASGFIGKTCWACYLHSDAQRAAISNAIRRATPEGRAKHNAATYTWAKKYPEKNAALRMKYHAAKLQRIPLWADLDAIKRVYLEAQQRGLEVDHIYPLQGALVSGLHVANNLQLLTKAANCSKHNKMPDAGQIN